MRLRSLALVGWIVLCLALAEVALEVRAHARGWDTLLFGPVMRVAPEVPGAGPAQSSDPGSSEFGPSEGFPFRSARLAPERRAGVTRVWIASASHAEDVHLPAPLVFPNRLATLRSSAGAPTEVLNASQAGVGIAGNIGMLRDLGPVFRPDVVVLYQASLDIGTLADREEQGGAVALDLVEVDVDPPEVAWWLRTYESTSIYALLKGTLTSWLGTQRVLSDRLDDASVSAFEQLVRIFVATARAEAAQPVLATFATSHDRDDLGAIPDQVVLDLFQFSRSLSMLGWIDAVERCNAVLERVARDEGVPLVDVAAAMGGRPEYFRDFVHFTPEGHALLAATIAETLDRMAPPAAASAPGGRAAPPGAGGAP